MALEDLRKPAKASFADRAGSGTVSPLARYLFSLISIKRSNLCVSADVHTTDDLIRVAEAVGDSICVLKIHADIIDDFSEGTIRRLQDLSRQKSFLIFEDRKLGDIGSQLLPWPLSGADTETIDGRYGAITVRSRPSTYSLLGSPNQCPPPPRPVHHSGPPRRRSRNSH